MVHGDFGSSQLCLFVEVLSAPGCFLSLCYNACLWDLPPWLWRTCSSFLSYSTGPASVVTSAASCWLLASLQDWRRSLCWLIPHFCHVGKSGQLMQCAIERKLPVYLFASEDACVLACDACFLPTGMLGGQAGIQATSESSSLNRTWSSWSLFFSHL